MRGEPDVAGVALRRFLGANALLAGVLFSGGAAYWLLGEGRWTMAQTLYMSLIAVSTVGFAELPGIETVHGARVVTSTIILAGIGAVAYVQSTLTALLVEGAIGHAWRRKRMRQAIESLNGHVVVAGVGSTGRWVIEELVATGTPFVVIDKNGEHLARVHQELGDRVLHVHGDATEDHTLAEAGVERASGVIAALTNDKDNLFVTLSARSMNATARIVAKVVEPEAAPKMARAGANSTVSPNQIGGRRMASELVRPEVVEFLDQMLRDRDRNLRLEELVVQAGSPYDGVVLGDVAFAREANVLVVAVRTLDHQFHYNPAPDHVLAPGTVLVVLGESSDIVRLRAVMGHGRRSTTPAR